MGMFDYIRVKLPLDPLPLPDHDGAFQTKDTPSQFMDYYEIREDGTLWLAEWDYEDRSDPNATGLERLIGSRTRVNQRWVAQSNFFGRINFYGDYGPKVYTEHSAGWGTGWIEFEADFVDGKLLRPIKLIKNRVPLPVDPEEQERLKEKFRCAVLGEAPTKPGAFKVGDKIVCIKKHINLEVGRTYVVQAPCWPDQAENMVTVVANFGPLGAEDCPFPSEYFRSSV